MAEPAAADPVDHDLPRRRAGLSSTRRRVAVATAVVALPALTTVLVSTRGELALGSVLLLFLLLDVVVAALGGLWPGIGAAAASLFAANWFLTPPYHTLVVERRDSIVELVVFAVVALVVSLTVEIAARDRVRAGRSAAEADLVARFTDQPVAEASVHEVLEQVRRTFGMASAALVRTASGARGSVTVLARAGVPASGAPSLDVPVDQDLSLLAYGPELFAEDRRVVERLAVAAARAWESQVLAETDRARAALLAAVGHELRTPLAGLKAAVSSLRQDDVAWSPTETGELLATIEDSADRLTDLIANLLDMSRLQAGGVTGDLVAVALDEVVSRAVLDYPPDQVRMAVPDDLPLVFSDPGLLERVVANLVDNARRHSPPGSPCELTAAVAGSTVRLSVRDHGPGVPSSQWSTMFEPFQRLGDRTADASVGLGLAIVRGFCETLGVQVTPAGTPGGGLTMTLEIPVAR